MARSKKNDRAHDYREARSEGYFASISTAMVVVVGGIALIGAFVLVSVFGVFATTEAQQATADQRGETDLIEQTRADGSYRLAKYEWFFDQCAAVQAAEARISILEEELATTPEDDQQRVRTNITASLNQRAELISEYNAEARKEGTAAQFMDDDLPSELDMNADSTSCTAS